MSSKVCEVRQSALDLNHGVPRKETPSEEDKKTLYQQLGIYTYYSKVSINAETEWNWEVPVTTAVHALKPAAIFATLCQPKYKKLTMYSSLTKSLHNPVSVQFVEPLQLISNIVQEQHILFIIDLGCKNIGKHFEAYNVKNHFRSPYRWLLIDTLNETTEAVKIPKSIENVALSVDTEIIVASQTSAKIIEFHYIYKIYPTKLWQRELYATLDDQGYFEKKIWEPTAIRRFNLQGHQITVCHVVLDNDTIDHMTDGKNQHVDTITKVNFVTVNHLLDLLNASRNYIFENTWGYYNNGTWNGLTGLLLRKEADIGGTPMFMISERLSIVEYVSSPTPTQMKFVFQQPKLSYTSNLFLLSFKTKVWYSALGLIFLMFLALFAVANWEWKRNKDSMERITNERILRGNVLDVVIVVIGAACQQGSPAELKGSLGRIVMFILFLTLMFLYTSYSANIVALLQSSSSQIKTLDDLLHSRLKLAVHDTVYSRHYFSTANEPIRKAIYQTKIAPPGAKPRFILSMEEGVKNIQKGLFAFHMELGVGYRLINKNFKEGEKCSLAEMGFLNMLDPWQAIQKHTPYKEMFKIGFKRINEYGLQKREHHRLYEKRPKCSGRESHFISVSMVDCYPALLVLLYGMSISIIFLVMEILLKKRERLIEKLCCRIEDTIK